MSLFKTIFLCLLVFGLLLADTKARADEPTASSSSTSSSRQRLSAISFSYFSWNEKVDFSNGGQSDKGTANLFGNSLAYERSVRFNKRFEFIFQGTFYTGVANVGGTQSHLSYQLNSQKWWGVGLGGREAYRLSSAIMGSAGVAAIYRGLSLPSDPSGTTAESGRTANMLFSTDLHMRLTNEFEVREEIGVFAFNASTFWAFGAGCRF